MLGISTELPEVTVSYMNGEDIIPVPLRSYFEDGLHILVGVPGAYTPVCTINHLPSLIEMADDLHAMGVKNIVCMSDDNPWAMDTWRKSLEGQEKLVFLCDGNREFLEASGMKCNEAELFLDGKYGRFYAIIKNGVIKRVRYETSVLKTVCTDGESIKSDVQDYLGDRNAKRFA